MKLKKFVLMHLKISASQLFKKKQITKKKRKRKEMKTIVTETLLLALKGKDYWPNKYFSSRIETIKGEMKTEL